MDFSSWCIVGITMSSFTHGPLGKSSWMGPWKWKGVWGSLEVSEQNLPDPSGRTVWLQPQRNHWLTDLGEGMGGSRNITLIFNAKWKLVLSKGEWLSQEFVSRIIITALSEMYILHKKVDSHYFLEVIPLLTRGKETTNTFPRIFSPLEYFLKILQWKHCFISQMLYTSVHWEKLGLWQDERHFGF